MMRDFDKEFDIEALKANMKEMAEQTVEFKEVPAGKYECKIEKIELNETKKTGMPMCSIQFRIVEGEFNKQCLFYNKVLITTDSTGKMNAFGLHINNEFLRSLDTSYEVVFEDFTQYKELLRNIADDVEPLTYLIEYTISNGFGNFKVKEIYED